tara:strand:+ start:1576 stop:2292 length:717 start_codon:yes stop_codon:yes gene_type:complete
MNEKHVNESNDTPSREELIIRGLSVKNVFDFENAFYWFSHPTRINKLLAQYEIYKTIIGIPGDVFELGVFKAASLIRLAAFRNTLENDYSRKIVGFDAFGKFPTENLSMKSDLDFVNQFEGVGGQGLTIDEVEKVLKHKSFNHIQLRKGNIFKTLPLFLEENPATRLAMLHLDMDVKEPTSFALDLLYERIVPGGVIVVDDYNAVEGATQAVDDFLQKTGLKIEKDPFYVLPSYIRKR